MKPTNHYYLKRPCRLRLVIRHSALLLYLSCQCRAVIRSSMQSINRFLYGPTPEEKVRAWQTKLRSESRQLEREMRQVGS